MTRIAAPNTTTTNISSSDRRMASSKNLGRQWDQQAGVEARERPGARAADHGQLPCHHVDKVAQIHRTEELPPAEGVPFHAVISCRLRLAQGQAEFKP